jgi:hypothetical protein
MMIIAKELIYYSSLAWPDVRKAVKASARQLFWMNGPVRKDRLRKQESF